MPISSPALKLSISATALSAALATSAVASDPLEQAGDIIQLAIPLAAFGMTYLFDDVEGRKQFAKSALTTEWQCMD